MNETIKIPSPHRRYTSINNVVYILNIYYIICAIISHYNYYKMGGGGEGHRNVNCPRAPFSLLDVLQHCTLFTCSLKEGLDRQHQKKCLQACRKMCYCLKITTNGPGLGSAHPRVTHAYFHSPSLAQLWSRQSLSLDSPTSPSGPRHSFWVRT